MDPILDGLIKAFILLVTLDPEVYSIMALTLRVSGLAVMIGAVIGFPIGATAALSEFKGKRLFVSIINTLMGLPPVVVGLLVYLLLSASGPLGPLQLLYTPNAMVIAQLIIAIPIVVGVTISAVGSVDKSIRDKALSLGASKYQLILTIIREARVGLITAVILAFGAAISEVGAVMIVGGNIRWYTRVLTSAIVFETELGEFSIAIALGLILLLLAFIINWVLTYLQWSGLRR
ncbi:MAG: ABC transporter permease [Candidatus Bathyarchaeia archaeon]|jgi:tungstate transport system permease protein